MIVFKPFGKYLASSPVIFLVFGTLNKSVPPSSGPPEGSIIHHSRLLNERFGSLYRPETGLAEFWKYGGMWLSSHRKTKDMKNLEADV